VIRRAAAPIALALGLLAAAEARSADETAERLARMRAEIDLREARARELAERAEGELGLLEAADRELALVRASVRALRRQMPVVEAELRAAEQRTARAESDLGRIQRELEARLVALYKVGAATGLSTLYASTDVTGLARRREALARILGEDTRLFESHREARERLQESRAASGALLAELRATEGDLTVREDRARRAQVERRNLVALLRTRSERELRAVDELREAASRLERTLGELPAGFEPASGAAFEPGGILPPVEGRVRAGFGRQVDPEFGTSVVRHGIEIEAEEGAPVCAVADGRVLFAGWFRGYGQIVIIDHGERSVTVSGYLEEIAVDAGDGVLRGQEIGTVGETGSLAGPGLYFEIRREGRPVDPASWLQARLEKGSE
jgi:septal ring factor EnvC (AmiA/AmiB activator)